jgi:predicted lipoprotein with Yx(FWY)xxD motif
MQKKNTWIGSIIIILIIVVVGGFLIFHKSSKPATTSSNQSTTNSSTTAVNNDIVKTKTASGIGQYLANSNGAALYTYSGDTKGVSNCTGSCADDWPPYSPSSSSATLPANITIITRSDGSMQYAYKGQPLYTFASDPSGQVTGNGVGGFSVAKP